MQRSLQQTAAAGSGGQSPAFSLEDGSATPKPCVRGSPGAPEFGSCPATSSEHSCSLHCSGSLHSAGAESCSGSCAHPCQCQLRALLGEDPGAGLIKSWEAASDPVMYSSGKVTRLCLTALLCLKTFHASLADIYLDFPQGL